MALEPPDVVVEEVFVVVVVVVVVVVFELDDPELPEPPELYVEPKEPTLIFEYLTYALG